jgi:hypothetical protein
MDRDEVASEIVGGTPNRIDWLQGPFLGNVLISVVPLLGILAAASTDLADLIHSWLDPVIHVLRRLASEKPPTGGLSGTEAPVENSPP